MAIVTHDVITVATVPLQVSDATIIRVKCQAASITVVGTGLYDRYPPARMPLAQAGPAPGTSAGSSPRGSEQARSIAPASSGKTSRRLRQWQWS